MQAQLPPACRAGGALPAPPLLPRAGKPFSPCLRRHPRPTPSLKHNPTRFTSPFSSGKSPQSLSPSSSIPLSPSNYTRVSSTTLVIASSPISTAYASPNDDPVKAKLAQAPPRAEVVKSLKKNIVLNLLGMGAAVLGMQATVGLLAAKALTSSVNPFYQGIPPGYSPVLALDVFLVQASANTILSHFLGLVCSLGLLRSVTSPLSEIIPVPRIA